MYILPAYYIHVATNGNTKNSVKIVFWKYARELTSRDTQTVHFTLLDLQKSV